MSGSFFSPQIRLLPDNYNSFGVPGARRLKITGTLDFIESGE
jgi:hypothetical protein